MTDQLTPEQIQKYRELCEAATPGPWGWRGNVDNRNIYLCTLHSGWRFVMDCVRWGTQQAQFRFQPKDDNHGMVKAADRAIYEVCPTATSRADKRVYRGDIIGINHPDAEFIATARTALPQLLGAYEEATREAERLRGLLEPGKAPAIVEAMFQHAERLGHSPFSAKHALSFFIETVEQQRTQLSEAQQEISRLTDALGRHDPDVRTVCAYECGIEDGKREATQLLRAAVEVLENLESNWDHEDSDGWFVRFGKPLLDKLKAHTEKGEEGERE